MTLSTITISVIGSFFGMPGASGTSGPPNTPKTPGEIIKWRGVEMFMLVKMLYLRWLF